MNIYILLLFLPLVNLTVVHGQAYVYHPFPESNAQWYQTSWSNIGGYPCYGIDSSTLFMKGDTLIKTKIYHKVYRSGFLSSTCGPSGPKYPDKYAGAFRQDISQKKVFYIDTYTNASEYLLYDFNLTVGDTLHTANSVNWNYVSSIDSVLVGSNYHKRFLLNDLNDPNFALIEGVGSTMGLSNFISKPFESGSELICFGYNGQNYPSTSNCTMALGFVEQDKTTSEIKIFPNPFSSKTTLYSGKKFKDVTLTVYNTHGQSVKQLKNISGHTVELYFGNLARGIYVLEMEDGNKIITREKLIITQD